MSLISGLLSVQNADTTDLVGEWAQEVTVRHAKGIGNGAVLFALMTMLRKEAAEATEYHWWERDPVRTDFFATAGFASGVTTLTFDDGSGNPVWPALIMNTVLENSRTGEFIRVLADPTNANISVERGHAGTTAAAILTSDLFTAISMNAEEGSAPATATYDTPSAQVNYIGTFDATVNLTNAFKGSVLRTDMQGPLRQRRLWALEKISKNIELSMLFGRKNRIVGQGGNFIYSTGGIRSALQSANLTANILNGNLGTGVSLATFQQWLLSFMPYGSTNKLWLCGSQAFAAVSNYANTAAGGFRIMNNETVFGMNITTIVTPMGMCELVFHPLLHESSQHRGSIVVVDLPLLTQKVMEPLFLEPNVQLPGQDTYKEQFRAKLGLKLKFPQAFGHAYNLQLITAS